MNLIPALSSRRITKCELLSGMKKFARACVLLLAASEPLANAQPVKMQQMLDLATQGTGVIALVVDAKSGHLLAVERPQDAAHLRSRPGSILKPFFLAGALEQNLLRPQTTVFCRRSLHILGRDLSCTHPQSEVVFSAGDALAYSCNTYFAELANRLFPTQATTILRSYGLGEPTHYFAAESSSDLQTPADSEHKQLFVLGLAGVSVTPAQMAAAYLKLALRLNDPKTAPAAVQDWIWATTPAPPPTTSTPPPTNSK